MLIDVEKIIIKDRIRKDFGDIKELANDIKDNGLINPPVVNKNYELLAGERRLRACKSLGWKQIPVTMMDTRDAEHDLEIEISENEVRKDFSKSERIDYARRLERIESAKAKERMSDGGKGVENFPQAKTRDIVAEKMGIGSGKQYEKEKAIVDNQNMISIEDFKDWDEGKLSTNKAYQKIKQAMAEKDRKISDLENRKPEIKEVVKEVIPPDYEDLRHKAEMSDIHERDFRRMQGLYDEMAEKWKKENIEKERIKTAWQKEKDSPTEELRKSALSFCAGISNFIERYGGYVWLTEKLNDLPEKEREGFVTGINALEAWVQQMKYNMEGKKNE